MADITNIRPGMPKPKPLEVKPENIVFFNVEENNEYKFNNLTAEQQAEVTAHNQEFETNVIQRVLLDRAAPCQCQMPRLMERIQTKIKLGVVQPGPNGQIPMELLQEDVDTRQFGVVVESRDGLYNSVKVIITKCKGCGDIHFHGDIEAITRLFAGAYANEVDIEAAYAASGVEEAIARTMNGDADDDSPQFMMENTETGERTSADDLGEALFGTKGADAVRMEPAEPEQPNAE